MAAPSPEELRREFLLDPEVAFLNHGSFGACPRPVFECFQAERDWDAVRDRCRRLARDARAQLCELLGTEPLAPDSMLAQMAAVRLPRLMPGLSGRLFARHRVEIPVTGPADDLLRLSVAGYTTGEEIGRLLTALARELDAEHGQQDE